MGFPRFPGDPSGYEQNNSAPGGRINAVQHGDQYNYIYLGAPPYRVEPFPFARLGTPPEGPARVPSRLLAARHQVVPFAPRDELTLLERWRDRKAPRISVRLIHAEGGAGKTRLAAEFAAGSARSGWTVAQARHRSEVASAGGGDESLAVRAPGLVIIVDYAERWPRADLIALVEQHRDAARNPLRVLLLSRCTGGWWEDLRHQFVDKLDIEDTEAIPLAPLPDDGDAREQMYTLARDRFAEIFDVEGPGRIAVPSGLDDPVYALMLTVHMRALVDVDVEARGLAARTESSQAALSSYLLNRERDYWLSSYDEGHGPVRTSAEAMSRTVYVATLTRSLPLDEATTALIRAGVAADTATATRLVKDHARCYPPADADLVLDPLHPDRLGEDYLALTLPGREQASDYHATDPWAATAPARLLGPDDDESAAAASHALSFLLRPVLTPPHAPGSTWPPRYVRQGLTVLIEAGHRWPHVTSQHIRPLLLKYPTLALTLTGAALSRLAELDSLDLEVLEKIESRLPLQPHASLDAGALAIVERLAGHRLATTSDPAELAEVYGGLAWRRAVMGRLQPALEAGRESVRLFHELALADPDGHSGLYIGALSDLGNILTRLGRFQEAVQCGQEAVQSAREAAETGFRLHRGDLARALQSYGDHLSKAGHLEEALSRTRESTEMFQELASESADPYMFEYAMALNNLAQRLLDLDRMEEAEPLLQQSLTIRRRLAEPQPGYFEPGVAHSLLNLCYQQVKSGQPSAAADSGREAVARFRELARSNPAQYHPPLALTLCNLAEAARQLGLVYEALDCAHEAVELYRELAVAEPGLYQTKFAGALNDLGVTLMLDRQFDRGESALTEALRIHHELGDREHEKQTRKALLLLRYTAVNASIDQRVAGAREESDITDLARELAESHRELVAADPSFRKGWRSRLLILWGDRFLKRLEQ